MIGSHSTLLKLFTLKKCNYVFLLYIEIHLSCFFFQYYRLKKVQEKKKKMRVQAEKEKEAWLAKGEEEAATIFDDFKDPEILFD